MLNIANEDRFFINVADPNPIFDIRFAGISYPNNHYFKRREKPMNVYVFEYVMAGRGYIESSGYHDELHEGDLYIINTHYPHSYRADEHDPFEKIWINASGLMLDKLAEVYLPGKPYIIRHSSQQVLKIFNSIRDMLSRKEHCAPNDLNKIALLLHELMIIVSSPAEETKPRSVEHNLRHYIDAHLTHTIQFNKLAERYYISENQLIRRFRREFGVTPKQYLLNRRCDIADELMEFSDMTLTQIAEFLGFSGLQHFSAIYKSKRGYSPQKRNK